MATLRRRVRRTQKRVTRSSLAPARIQAAPHTFCRSFHIKEALTSLTGIDYIAAGQSNWMAQLPSASEFSALFDQYKIRKVEWTYCPRFTELSQAAASAAVNIALPRFYSAVDQDDATIPTSLNQMMQYANLKGTPFNKPVKITYTPSVSTQVYGSLTTTGYASKKNQWLDINNLDVSHYGHKVWIELNNVNWSNTFKVDVYCRITFECKNLR